MIESVITMIAAGLTALARVAPDVAKAITGGRDPQAAIDEAREAARRIPVREGGGAWSDDLDERLERGGGDARPASQRPPPNPFPED